MNHFFSADYHLGHANIIIYCNRPQLKANDLNEKDRFKTSRIACKRVIEMNRMIIKNHNEVVKPDDTVIHIGDFCFKNSSGGKQGEGEKYDARYYESKLNGKIIEIQGNHDKNNSCKTIIQSMKIKYGGYKINLVHKPEHANFNCPINLTGHCHTSWKIKRFENKMGQITDCINCGIDVWGYRPIQLKHILQRYAKFLRLLKANKLPFPLDNVTIDMV